LTLSYLANGQSGLGKYEDELATAKRCAQVDPDVAFCLVDLGDALENMGRLEESTAAYERAISLGGR